MRVSNPIIYCSLLTYYYSAASCCHAIGLRGTEEIMSSSPNNKTKTFDSSSVATKEIIYDVVILGAGWAGLGAANKLLLNNTTNFKVLEAQNYVGGRSKTFYDWGEHIPVELGSAWIQGTKNNPIQALVDTYHVNYGSDPGSEVFYDPTGHRLTDDVKNQIETTYGVDDEPTESDDTFIDYVDKKLEQMPKTTDVDLQTVSNEYVKAKHMNSTEKEQFSFFLMNSIAGCDAADINKLSLRWFDSGPSFGGGDHYLAVPGGGYSALVHKYAESILPYIQLETVVTQVDYSTTPVQVHYVTSDGKESILLAKKVIVTLPLGVLKAGAVEFIPAFSKAGTKGQKKQAAIDQLGMGVQNKIVLYWKDMQPSDVFWPKDRQWIGHITDSKLQGNMTLWYSAYSMNGNIPILVGWLQGELAERMESLTDEQITRDAVDALRELFGDVPDPSHSIITRWKSEKFAQGSYSFPKIGSNEFSRADLAAPLYEKLFFAGEATSEYYGMTHGALMSGFDAACSILKYSGISDC